MLLRLPLAKRPVPKPKGHHTGNEADEIGIEDRSQVRDGYPLLRYHHPGDGPVDG